MSVDQPDHEPACQPLTLRINVPAEAEENGGVDFIRDGIFALLDNPEQIQVTYDDVTKVLILTGDREVMRELCKLMNLSQQIIKQHQLDKYDMN